MRQFASENGVASCAIGDFYELWSLCDAHTGEGKKDERSLADRLKGLASNSPVARDILAQPENKRVAYIENRLSELAYVVCPIGGVLGPKAEAIEALGKIADSYHTCTSAKSPVPRDVPKGGAAVKVDPKAWDGDTLSGWKCLDFTGVSDTVHFQYQFASNGKSGDEATLEAIAKRDIDGHGKMSVFGVKIERIAHERVVTGPQFVGSDATGWSVTSSPGVKGDD